MLDKNAGSILDNVRVASPCTVDWDTMTGDERTRFCHECKLNVHNLSAMTQDEAEGLLKRRKEGERLCISFYQRSDGTVLTQDCPVGIKLLQMKARRAWNKVASFVSLFLCLSLSAQAEPGKDGVQSNGCATRITVSDPSLKTGTEAYDRGDYPVALKFFQEFCAKNPKNDEARYYLGLSLRALNQNRDAMKQFKILGTAAASAEIRAAANENINAMNGTKITPQRTMGMVAPRVQPVTPPAANPQMIKGDYIEIKPRK